MTFGCPSKKARPVLGDDERLIHLVPLAFFRLGQIRQLTEDKHHLEAVTGFFFCNALDVIIEKPTTVKTENKMKPTNPNADTYVEKQRLNTYLSQFPANPFVEHPDLTHWGDTLVGHPCLTLLRYALVRHSCMTLWFDTLAGHSCLTLF